MAIIDDKGAKSIAGWFKDTKDRKHVMTINVDNLPLTLKLDNDVELATLKLICMRNSIKFTQIYFCKISVYYTRFSTTINIERRSTYGTMDANCHNGALLSSGIIRIVGIHYT